MAYNFNPMPQRMNMFNMISQFNQNPVGLLSQRFNIPQGMNDPNQILQHLINTNQVSRSQVDMFMQMNRTTK